MGERGNDGGDCEGGDEDAVWSSASLGRSGPSYTARDVIESLLETCDAREEDLVQQLVFVDWDLCQQLDRTVSASDSKSAKRAWKIARARVPQVLELVELISNHRRGGVQKFSKVTVRGPTVGLAAKLAALRAAPPDSAEARLIARVRETEWQLGDVATRLREKAMSIMRSLNDDDARADTWRRGTDEPSEAEGYAWHDLSVSASGAMLKVGAFLNKLERGGRQVSVVDEGAAERVPAARRHLRALP